MEIKKIAQLIQSEFGFINEPTEEDIKKIVSKISDITTEQEFKSIVIENVSNTLSYANESADMSDTVSLLRQLKMMIKDN